MKMKKISKLISLSVIMCLLISSICVLNVSAATGDLLYDMNLSGFQKGNAGESWGITNNVSTSEATIKLNDGVTTDGTSTGNITLDSFTNVKGKDIPYLNFNQIVESGDVTGENSCNRIWIEDTAWKDKMITAEVWLKIDKPTDTTKHLLNLFGEADDDRSSLDRYITFDATKDGKWKTDSKLSTDNNILYSETNFSNGEWVHVAIVRHLEGNAGKSKIPIYVNGTAIRTSLGLKAVTEKVAGLLIGTVSQTSVNNAPNNLGIASVKIYDGELTKAQVQTHYNAEADNFTTSLLCEETVYADDESFTVDLTDITEDVPKTEQGTLTLGDEEIEAEFSYDEETKKLSVTPRDYLLGGKSYILSFGGSLSGAIRINVKTSTIEVEDVSYSGDAVDYTITGDGTERQIMVLAVGYDATGELLTGAVYEKYVLSGTDAESKTLSAPKLVDANSIKFMVWEICDGYTRPLADIIEIK